MTLVLIKEDWGKWYLIVSDIKTACTYTWGYVTLLVVCHVRSRSHVRDTSLRGRGVQSRITGSTNFLPPVPVNPVPTPLLLASTSLYLRFFVCKNIFFLFLPLWNRHLGNPTFASRTLAALFSPGSPSAVHPHSTRIKGQKILRSLHNIQAFI